jgi:hypothetical protein
MRKFDLEIFMQQNPEFEKRRQERKERKEWFKNRRNGKPVTKRMCYKL